MDESKKKTIKGLMRFGLSAKGTVYFLAGILTAMYAIGVGGQKAGQKQALKSVMDLPLGGQILVEAVAVILFAVGVGQVVIAVKAKFMEGEKKSEMSQKEIKTVRAFGRLGYSSRGVVSAIIGYFFMRAAVTANPGQARGTEGAFSFLQSTAYGPVLLVIVALGLLSYGLFIFVSVKYKRMNI